MRLPKDEHGTVHHFGEDVHHFGENVHHFGEDVHHFGEDVHHFGEGFLCKALRAKGLRHSIGAGYPGYPDYPDYPKGSQVAGGRRSAERHADPCTAHEGARLGGWPSGHPLLFLFGCQ